MTDQNWLVAVTNQLGPKNKRIVYIWANPSIYLSVNVIVVYLSNKVKNTYVEHFTHLEGRKRRGAGTALPGFPK